MKKIPLTIISAALILTGWFLEVYYYQFRFSGDGIHSVISWIIGGGLTLLLSSLFLNTKKRKLVFAVPLILFSIFCTTAGQNYSYNKSQNENSIKNTQTTSVQDKYNSYTVRINELEEIIHHKSSLIPDDLKKRTYLNTNGVQPLLKEIQGLRDDLKHYENLRDDLDLSTTQTVNKSAYEMLADDLGFNSPTPLKLISQAILSLFIALMAPSGIRILSAIYPQGDKVVKKKETKATGDDIYTRYVNSRFRGQEKPDTLKGRGGVVEEARISYNNFNKLAKLEKDLNLVTKEGNSTIPNVSKSEFIMMLRNKRMYKGCMTVVQ